MTHRKIIVADNNPSSRKVIAKTLQDAQLEAFFVDNTDDAWSVFQNEDVTLVLLRGIGVGFESTEFCRRVRSVQSSESCSIVTILTEADLPRAAELLVAGANELLIQPFEPRELRMRAAIVPADQVRRVDAAHVVNGGLEPELIIPELNPQTWRMDFGFRQNEVRGWEANPDVRKVKLDTMCVCPECEAAASFRPGCESCGSAFVEQRDLIHHYACAHVGPESEFRGGGSSELSCPKCRMKDLVSGADFELTEGCLACTDCNALFSETKMIGHCMGCNHRFVAKEAKTITIYGYQFGRPGAQANIPAPNYQTVQADSLASAAQNEL